MKQELIVNLLRQCSSNQMVLTHDVDLERFAEMIIKECVDVCLDQRDPGNLNYKPSLKFATAITDHFGITQ